MYKCNNCGYQSPKFFGLCPKCKAEMGHEVPDEPERATPTAGRVRVNVAHKIYRVDPSLPEEKASKVTQYPGLNSILSTAKGFIDGQTILLGASPGVGKSTLCISISDEDTLYISSEENYRQVNARAVRVNPKCKCSILCSTNIDEIISAIESTDKKMIIVDSLNSIEFGVGYITTAKYANDIVQAVKRLNKICIIISQVGKTGEVSGMNSIVHMVDTVMHLERAENSANVIATTSKNRYGEIGGVCAFAHRQNGFEEVNIDLTPDQAEIGTTYTKTRFGHKEMTISVEALTTTATNKYGMVRGSGYNITRIQLILGILSNYGKIDFTSKDVYVAISNGLYTDDVNVDLAIACSILSSLNNKANYKVVNGEMRLNGKIINGMVDGTPIHHIKEILGRN